MKILIDGDGCPVVYETILVAKEYNIPCCILCDTSHVYDYEGVETITFPKGADSVDFGLVNRIQKKDIVVTQDYGLASMCLAKQAFVLSQNGLEYTSLNMNELLTKRQESKKLRKMKVKMKNASKRTREQDDAFVDSLIGIIEREI